MSNARIVFKNADGSCGVIIPAPRYVQESLARLCATYTQAGIAVPDNLEDLVISAIALQAVPEGREYRITTVDNLPSDDTFREAWTDDNDTDTVDVDMPRARAVLLSRIRAARGVKFAQLGFPVRLHTSVEEAIVPQETRDILQALRDIPQRLDLFAVETPEALKEIWPVELGGSD
jgi:hypothetical protein